MPEKYRNELLHIKMREALASAHMGDRVDWLREASFSGTVFDPRVRFSRAPVDGTLLQCQCAKCCKYVTGEIGPLVTVTGGAATAKVPRFLKRSN